MEMWAQVITSMFEFNLEDEQVQQVGTMLLSLFISLSLSLFFFLSLSLSFPLFFFSHTHTRLLAFCPSLSSLS
jgi:hypothetical protein